LPDKSKVFIDVSADTTRIIYDKNKSFARVNNLYLNGKKRFINPGIEWKEIIIDDQGVLAIEKKVGTGRIVLFSESDFLSNMHIRKEDNVLFAYNLISDYSAGFKDKIVYFEEYHHGFHKKFTFLYFFAKKEYSALILQTLLFFFMLFYYINIRFGQYRIMLSDEKKRIFYLSEGISGILSKRKYTENIYEKIKNNFFLMLKLKPYHYKKEAKEQVEELLKDFRDKNKNTGLIKKLFITMKKYENK